MPSIWGWLLVSLLGFLFFQALIYWYLRGDGASLDGPSSSSIDRDSPVRPAAETGERAPPGTDSGETIQCRHCGTDNEREPPYTYCRECLGQLR
jgi:hypothetical protein